MITVWVLQIYMNVYDCAHVTVHKTGCVCVDTCVCVCVGRATKGSPTPFLINTFLHRLSVAPHLDASPSQMSLFILIRQQRSKHFGSGDG